MKTYDLLVIGGGPAGYMAAQRAAENGLSVTIFEKRKTYGGVCLNEGCIPSKAYLNSGKIYHYAAKGAEYGVHVDGIRYDQEFAFNRKNEVVKKLTSGVKYTLNKLKVNMVNEEAKILSKGEHIFTVAAGNREYEGKNIIIATGSEVFIPPITGADKALETGVAVTSTEILDFVELPKSLIVVGGGVIGLEMAAYFNSVGVDVSVVEMMDKIAGSTEKEISKILQSSLSAEGIKFYLSAKVTEIKNNELIFEQDGESKSISADKILLSVGRRAVTKGFGLENIDVTVDRGAIVVDEHMRTNVLGVYACGDVNARMMLAHVAYRQAEVAVNHIISKKDYMRYSAIPAVIYTNPEVASIGLDEDACKAKGIECKVARISLQYSGRYIAESVDLNGICKITIEASSKRILGMSMIGPYASEIIGQAAIMIETQLRIDDIKEIVFTHPSISEIIREGVFEF